MVIPFFSKVRLRTISIVHVIDDRVFQRFRRPLVRDIRVIPLLYFFWRSTEGKESKEMMSYMVMEAALVEKNMVLLMVDLQELGCGLCTLCCKTFCTILRFLRRLKLDVRGRGHVSDTVPRGGVTEVRCVVWLCQRV